MLKFYNLYFRTKNTHALLITLLLIDMAFILFDIGVHYYVNKNSIDAYDFWGQFYVTSDGYWAEYFQYMKYGAIIIATLYLIIRRRKVLYFSWLTLFTFFLLDDALLFHEGSSQFLINVFNIKSIKGLEYQVIGELLYAIVVGTILLVPLVLTYFYGNQKFKNTFIDLFFLLLLFIFFGVGVDFLHGIFNKYDYLRYLLGVMEDGGEMLTLSLLAWYFLFLTVRPDSHNHFLYNYFENFIKNNIDIKNKRQKTKK